MKLTNFLGHNISHLPACKPQERPILISHFLSITLPLAESFSELRHEELSYWSSLEPPKWPWNSFAMRQLHVDVLWEPPTQRSAEPCLLKYLCSPPRSSSQEPVDQGQRLLHSLPGHLVNHSDPSMDPKCLHLHHSCPCSSSSLRHEDTWPSFPPISGHIDMIYRPQCPQSHPSNLQTESCHSFAKKLFHDSVPPIVCNCYSSVGYSAGLPWWLSGKESACNAGDAGATG